MFEQFRLGEWPFNGLLETVFDLQQSPNFVPTDFGDFNVDFTERRRLNVSYGFFEVIHADFHFLKDFGWKGFFFKVNFWEVASKSSHGRFSNQGS